MDLGDDGQHLEPATWNRVAQLETGEVKDFMAKYRTKVAEVINALPTHADFVRQYAGASPRRLEVAVVP